MATICCFSLLGWPSMVSMVCLYWCRQTPHPHRYPAQRSRRPALIALVWYCRTPPIAEPAEPLVQAGAPTRTVLVSLLFSYHSAVCLEYPHRLNAHAFPSAERPGTFVLHDIWGRQTQVFIIHFHRQNHPGLCHHDESMSKCCVELS